MQVNDNDMDELFARKLGNMEVAPPEDGWARIENELNRRNRMTRKYWLVAASFALVLSVTATMVYIQTNAVTEQSTTVSILEKTLQLPQEHLINSDDNIETPQENVRFVPQQNQSGISQLQNENSISESQVETETNTSLYVDSWDELRQAKPVKMD
jgi:hypothetical protein